MSQQPLLIILGPTAVGKTKLAVKLANLFNAEIISADSRQVFKHMDIGTGKDLSEYKIDGKQIEYHVIDNKLAGETYNVNEFKNDFFTAFDSINYKGKMPILCGGTGMYIHSLLQNQPLTAVPINNDLRSQLLLLTKEQLQNLLKNYPESFRLNVDFSSAKRLIRAIEIAEYLMHNEAPKAKAPITSYLAIGLYTDVETRRERILNRLSDRLNNGLIEEVEILLKKGVTKDQLIFYGLEYKFVVAYLSNEISFEALHELLGIAICQFAKRQMTFFRKMEKDGVKINWLDATQNLEELIAEASLLINTQ